MNKLRPTGPGHQASEVLEENIEFMDWAFGPFFLGIVSSPGF